MKGDKIPTKKQYREHLNTLGDFKNGKLGNIKRKYGDYLYAQDRDMFNVGYAVFCDIVK